MEMMSTFEVPSMPFSVMMPSARARVLYMQVFPAKGSPTIIRPCRTTIISYSSMVFLKKYGVGWRFVSLQAIFIASSMLS